MVRAVRTIAVCAAAAAALSAAGCSKITVMRTKEFVAARDTLRAELAAAQSRLIEEQNKLLAEQNKLMEEQKLSSEMLRLIRADQGARFSELDRRVAAIERNLYESQSRLSSLDQRTAEVNRRLERSMAAAQEAENLRLQQIASLFDLSMGDFNTGRYDIAISGFEDLIKQYPEAPQAADAEFWIAEAHFANKKYQTAEKLYFELVKKYPEGQRICVTLYKLGLAYEHQDKKKSRDMVWVNLLERCPDIQEAQAVKAQMESGQ
jgi:TolA-binding protein